MPKSPRTPSPIDALADEFVEKLIASDPELATHLGEHDRAPGYADRSPEGEAARRGLLADTLAALGKHTPADDTDRTTIDVMTERLTLEIELIDSGVTPLNNLASAPQDVRAVFDLMPTDTVEDWQRIAARLAAVPEALSGHRAALDHSRTLGHVPARRQIEAVLGQIDDYAGDEGFFAGLAAVGQAVAPGEEAALASGVAAARQAYRDLGAYLADDLQHDARETDAVGRDYYQLASRTFLGAAVDLDETYAWGVAELDRIIAEQERVAQRIEAGASVERAREVLNADPERQLHGTDALQAWMQQKSDSALAALAVDTFSIEPPLDRLECRIAPTHDGAIYYTPPSSDFSRPGRMWWSVPEGEDTFTTWGETSTVYHEGVPGHHLQCATAIAARAELNRYRSDVVWVSGHGEGWALYAERLMEQYGFLEDAGDLLGMLDAQRLRAARVVFDIGVHLGLAVPERWGSGTWTPEKAWDFLRANFNESEGRAQFEFVRYLGWPGQAPSYKVGERLWLQAREDVRAKEGAAYDERAFHDRALRLGSMGLDSLRRALLR
ncbi:DUF885 domain-containing protein [Micrococcales bacterium 31B]|nr:DUF885 domain-containing protein [Micrococcales bacterium 31B]